MIEIELIKNKKYPKIKNFRRNSYYQGILQNLYAGQDSELSAFLQLQYQAFSLEDFNNKISSILKDISLTDLKHLSLLANTIKMVGGDPVFYNSQRKWFGTRSIDYVKSVKQMLSLDIELKEKSIIDYKTAISKIDNKEVVILLTNILQDEERHKVILKNLLTSIK